MSDSFDRRSSYVRSGAVRFTQSGAIDHQRPLGQGGQMQHPNNHQVLQAQQNMSRGAQLSADYFPNATPLDVQQQFHDSVDYRSAAVRGGELCFLPNGEVDARSQSVRDGTVRLTHSRDIDRRSAAARQGDIFFCQE